MIIYIGKEGKSKMTMKQVTEYLDKKIEKNENFIKITFYEARVTHNLTTEETSKLLELDKIRLENLKYKVYFTNEKFTYQNVPLMVKQNELLIAVKEA